MNPPRLMPFASCRSCPPGRTCVRPEKSIPPRRTGPARQAGPTRIAFVAGLLAFASGPTLSAQEKQSITVARHGVDVFANLLHEEGLKPLTSYQELGDIDPRKTVIIILGRIECLADIERVVGRIDFFFHAGGALLIASDYPSHKRLQVLGVNVTGRPVLQSDESQTLQDFPDCPELLNAQPHTHPLLRDLERPLVAMRPSEFGPREFNPTPADLMELALYLRGSYVLSRPAPRFVQHQPNILASFPRTGERKLLIAGHGLFMNVLLVRRDYGNFLFARNTARWLSEGPDGPRTHVLLVEQNNIVRKLDLPLKMPEIPWAALLNIFADQIQRQGLIEELLDRNVSRERMWRVIIYGISALMLAFAVRRVMLARFRRDIKATLTVGLHDPAAPPLPRAEQQQREVLRRGNYAEPAAAFVRHWIAEETGGAALPSYEIDAGWWRRRRLEKRLRWLGRVYAGAVSVSARQFRNLRSLLTELTVAAQIGEIAFSLPLEVLQKRL